MDSELIELVRSYEELYDHGHKKYNDFQAKEKTWKAIGEKLNRPGLKCKMRWASLRDQYRRYLRKSNPDIGQDMTTKTKWRYADEISFVRPFLRERDPLASHDEERWNNDEAEEGDEEESLSAKRFRVEADPDQGLSEDISYRISRLRTPSPSLTKPVQTTETSLFELMKYLVDSNERKRKEDQKSLDTVDLFFQSIAATVKGFSPYYQNLCKTKVFQAVMEIELTQILEQYPAPTSTATNSETTTDIKIDTISSL